MGKILSTAWSHLQKNRTEDELGELKQWMNLLKQKNHMPGTNKPVEGAGSVAIADNITRQQRSRRQSRVRENRERRKEYALALKSEQRQRHHAREMKWNPVQKKKKKTSSKQPVPYSIKPDCNQLVIGDHTNFLQFSSDPTPFLFPWAS